MVTELKTIEKSKALVKINPIADPAYLALKDEVESLCRHIEGFVVDSPEAEKRVTADVNLGAKIASSIEKLRTEHYTGPINKHLKAINATFKALSDPIAKAREVAGKKISGYRAELRRQQEQVEAENKRLAAEHDAKVVDAVDFDTGEISGEIPASPTFTPIAPMPTKVTTDFGSSYEASVWKYECTDFSKVPDDLKMLNEKAVDSRLKSGVHDIPGLKIWEEKETKFRSK